MSKIRGLTVATVLLGTVLTGTVGTAQAEAPTVQVDSAPAAQQAAQKSAEQIVVIKSQRVKVSDLIPTAGNG